MRGHPALAYTTNLMKQYTSTFFGGQTVTSPTVKRLAANNFEEFVKYHLRVRRPLNITRDEYFRLPSRDRSLAKRAPYVTPCTFRKSPSPRRLEHAKKVSLICLDLDDPDVASPFCNQNGELAATLLRGFNFALYHTASSTLTAPRLRLMVSADLPLAGESGRNYAIAVAAVADLLEIPAPKITPESLIPVQPMYLPTVFRDDSDYTPMVVVRVSGRPFTVEDLPPTSSTQEDAIHTSSPTPTPTGEGLSEDVAALDFLRTPLEGVTLEHVEDALRHLDPDVTYLEWVQVLPALKHQFPRDPEAEAAYKLFDQWSARGEKYKSPEETRRKWDSFRAHPDGRPPRTVRSLFYTAQAAGWEGMSQVTQSNRVAFTAWLTDATEDADKLLDQGLRRIARMPVSSATLQHHLLTMLRDRVKVLTGMTVPLPTLKRDLRRLTSAVATASHLARGTPAWAEEWVWVSGPMIFFRPSTNEELTPESMDRTFSREVAATGLGEDGSPPRVSDYLLNTVKVPCVYQAIYDPRESTIFTWNNQPVVNRYRATHPEPNPDQAAEAEDLLLGHLENLIREPSYRALLMDYLAWQVQSPGCKVRWAPLIQGAQGCGKTFLSVALAAVLGQEHVATVNGSALRSQFNGWAAEYQVVTLEELRVAGRNATAIMDRLKPLLADATIDVNAKFRPAATVPNLTNYLMFTNHHDALALTSGDRRYFVLKCRQQNAEDVATLGAGGYFHELFRVTTELAGGLRAVLEDWHVGKEFEPDGHAPMTTYMQQFIADAATPLAEDVHDLLTITPPPPILDPSSVVSMTVLQEVLTSRGHDLSAQERSSYNIIASALYELGLEPLPRRVRLRDPRVSPGGENRHKLWVPRADALSISRARSRANIAITRTNFEQLEG